MLATKDSNTPFYHKLDKLPFSSLYLIPYFAQGFLTIFSNFQALLPKRQLHPHEAGEASGLGVLGGSIATFISMKTALHTPGLSTDGLVIHIYHCQCGLHKLFCKHVRYTRLQELLEAGILSLAY